ncbi:SycD/LcrH family type III secretion system chaperone [Arsenophonus sp.]|uniref:SycD/LcrH family type III secretion system chaperone n=1 Tax=Arsenophonus sp. TaxID=1872640 RepID=UPI00285838F9|nr:SycD/LcrH family type III secretion system chaperone [Arsenophonus sp.]MDR5617517.1 SycD/LcrH family type III secretion system chaperone [Arsenophonus sp.]
MPYNNENISLTQNEQDSFGLEETILTVMNTGATLKDIYEIDENVIENIYAHAYEFYQQGRLDDAEKFFKFLCMYDLKNADYFIGLGVVYQLKKDYAKACDIYALSYVMAKNNHCPVFYSGQCHLQMGDIAKALYCFDLVCNESTDVKLVKKAEVYRKVIKEARLSETEVKTETSIS